MARPLVHIVNPMWNEHGGSERRAQALEHALKPHADVAIWTEYPERSPRGWYRPITAEEYPRGGTLVILGVYFDVGPWLKAAKPERVIVVINTAHPTEADALVRRLGRVTGRAPEIVLASQTIGRVTGLAGRVERSPILVDCFVPRVRRVKDDPFTVGRLSRDVVEKHHPDDPALYRALVKAGCDVFLMGARCIESKLPEEGVQVLAAGHHPAPGFLRWLDCYLQRSTVLEGFGRTVIEAMCCELPLVVHRRGGYVELLEHERTALFFDDNAEALEHVAALRRSPKDAKALGRRARARALDLYGPAYWKELRAYYLG